MESMDLREGDLGEGIGVKIRIDYKAKTMGNRIQPCRHAGPVVVVLGGLRMWTTPRVVIALTAGGHDATAVCADCIAEAVDKLRDG